eukprot:110137-Hanusia_phi.AAC.3
MVAGNKDTDREEQDWTEILVRMMSKRSEERVVLCVKVLGCLAMTGGGGRVLLRSDFLSWMEGWTCRKEKGGEWREDESEEGKGKEEEILLEALRCVFSLVAGGSELEQEQGNSIFRLLSRLLCNRRMEGESLKICLMTLWSIVGRVELEKFLPPPQRESIVLALRRIPPSSSCFEYVEKLLLHLEERAEGSRGGEEPAKTGKEEEEVQELGHEQHEEELFPAPRLQIYLWESILAATENFDPSNQ